MCHDKHHLADQWLVLQATHMQRHRKTVLTATSGLCPNRIGCIRGFTCARTSMDRQSFALATARTFTKAQRGLMASASVHSTSA